MTTRVFSWAQAKDEALQIKLRRAKIMAKTKSNPDYNKKHPGDITEYATVKKYTGLTVRVTKEVKDKQALAIARRLKNVK